jgi:hypothetical protein
MQAVRVALAMSPAGQAVQDTLPELTAIVPGGQAWQACEPVGAKVPGGQVPQLIEPGGEVKPAGHGAQLTWPELDWKVPAAHGVHELENGFAA